MKSVQVLIQMNLPVAFNFLSALKWKAGTGRRRFVPDG
jgi:hypothetical protein